MPFLGTTGGGSVKQYGGQANLGYFIKNSLRTRSSASAYFNRTLTTPTLGTKWTWSGWLKRGTLGAAQTLFGGSSDVNNWGYFGFLSGDTLTFQQADAGSVDSTVTTTQIFRDPSAWYHIQVAFDSTQATAANRLLMYINGTQVTAFGTATYLAQNTASRINQAVGHTINRIPYSAANYFDGYLTETNFIDGQALTPSSFGKTDAVTGQWIPKKFASTYGTNGFYLKFADASAATAAAIGKDSSPNGNNWTPNNISVTAGTTYDAMIDSPTLSAVASNFATLNPLDVNGMTLTQGNLLAASTGATWKSTRSSIGMSTGKWYCEATVIGGNLPIDCQIGVGSATLAIASHGEWVASNPSLVYTSGDGNKWYNTVNSAYGASFTTGDVIGVAFDADALTVTFYKNNASQGTITTNWSAGTYMFLTGMYGRGGGTTSAAFNFGQRPFAYTPPSGFKSLNAFNLP